MEYYLQDPLGYQSRLIADEQLDLNTPEGLKRLEIILEQTRKTIQEVVSP